MSVQVNAFLQNIVTPAIPTQSPPCWGGIASLGLAWTTWQNALNDTSILQHDDTNLRKSAVKLRIIFETEKKNRKKMFYLHKNCIVGAPGFFRG